MIETRLPFLSRYPGMFDAIASALKSDAVRREGGDIVVSLEKDDEDGARGLREALDSLLNPKEAVTCEVVQHET